jgi:site-specific DNA recombinase
VSSDYIPPPKELSSGSVVWAYLRDSGGPSQEQSIGQQRAEVEAYCARYGLILSRIFVDEAKSGGSIEGREAFTSLLNISEQPDTRPAGLLLWNFARFARNLIDATYYKALLRKRGIVVHSMTDPIPEGDYGMLVETMIDITNAEKRRQNSRDVKRALRALVEQGYSGGGTPPRGYMLEKVTIGKKRDGSPRIVSRLVPDPELWDLVKLAWKLRAEGAPYREITEKTSGRLYRSKNCWTTFFGNKAYLGIGKCGGLEFPNHHEAAVDLETWQKVQEIRQAAHKSHPYHPRRLSSPSLLSGLAVCIHCGYAMVSKKDRHGWTSYWCGRKDRYGRNTCQGRNVARKKADKAITNAVLNRILTVDYFSQLLDATRSQFADISEIDLQLETFHKSLRQVDRDIHNLLDLVATFGAQSAGERIIQLEGERARLETEIQRLTERKAFMDVDISPEALELILETWRNEIIEAQRDDNVRFLKNALLRFVSKVELGYNQAKIWYTYPLSDLDTFKLGQGAWGHCSLESIEAVSLAWS